MKQYLKDFAPWILFSLLVGLHVFPVQSAAILAVLLQLMLGYKNLKNGFTLSVGTCLVFTFLSISSFFPFYPSLEKHPAVVFNAALTAIMWLSLCLRRPFTLEITKTMVAQELHTKAHFIRKNYFLTLVWASAMTLMTLIAWGTDFLLQTRSVIVDTLPAFLLVIGTHFTQWQTGYYRRKWTGVPPVPLVNIESEVPHPLKDNITIAFKPAQPKNAFEIAHFMEMASGGVIEYLLHNIDRERSAFEIMQQLILDETSVFFYGNTSVADIDGKIVGIAHAIPLDSHKPPEETKTFIPRERIDRLKPIFEEDVPNSLYLQSLSIDPTYRGMHIGKSLLQHVEARAKKHGFSNITVHVWADNKRIITWYTRHGFTKLATHPIEKHPLLPHKGGIILLKKELQ